jgi:hypothetical protein
MPHHLLDEAIPDEGELPAKAVLCRAFALINKTEWGAAGPQSPHESKMSKLPLSRSKFSKLSKGHSPNKWESRLSQPS